MSTLEIFLLICIFSLVAFPEYSEESKKKKKESKLKSKPIIEVVKSYEFPDYSFEIPKYSSEEQNNLFKHKEPLYEEYDSDIRFIPKHEINKFLQHEIQLRPFRRSSLGGTKKPSCF